MIDAWDRYCQGAEVADCSGYFEVAPSPGSPGRAWWFHDGAERLSLGRSDSLRELRSATRSALAGGAGGVLGYVGFDAVGLFEPALARFPSGAPFPLGEFALVPRLQTAPVRPSPKESELRSAPPRPISDSLSRRPFERAVVRLTEAIRDGEAFQVVLAHRRAWKRPVDLLARAARLRRTERFSFFFHLRFGDRVVVGASPESVSELRGSTAWLDPIAGTIPAGPRRGRLPLARDPKELAEHRMLVDLARNDLGAIAMTGSVRLPWSERKIRYARLDHLVSRVQGRVPREAGPWELLAATFPAGTVSGAPKIRAVELLRAEERSWRGPYGGAVGLLLPRRRASWALAIRSGFAAGRRLYTSAGAGIVHRSRPSREYDETLAKLSLVESVLVGETL